MGSNFPKEPQNFHNFYIKKIYKKKLKNNQQKEKEFEDEDRLR